jgi:hypothetical protein
MKACEVGMEGWEAVLETWSGAARAPRGKATATISLQRDDVNRAVNGWLQLHPLPQLTTRFLSAC